MKPSGSYWFRRDTDAPSNCSVVRYRHETLIVYQVCSVTKMSAMYNELMIRFRDWVMKKIRMKKK